MDTAMNHPLPINATSAPDNRESSIGALLLESGKITPEGAERVLRMQKELGIRFGEAAQRLGLINDADIAQVLARQFDYPYLQPGEGQLSPNLVAAFNPFSSQVETLRAVRSQLMLRWFSRGHKSLTIVGLEPGDGTSLFAANLAIVFSQLGENTLLVDANLRNPAQHQIFALKGRQGLSDILAKRAQISLAERIETLRSLSVLPAGTLPPNPIELLSRTSFAGLNLQLESSYDIVLYDTPAFTTASDMLPLAARTGGVLLVVRKNSTSLNNVGALTEQVNQAGGKVLGSVLVDF
jgi:protein-tyrosine kinase